MVRDSGPTQRQETDGPVATPGKARDLVRTRKSRQGGPAGPIRVYLRGGTYFLGQPLTSAPKTRARSRPRSFGRPIRTAPCFERRAADHRLDQDHRQRPRGMDGEASRWRRALVFRELWLDGKRLLRARWPHKGTLEVAGLSDKRSTTNGRAA